MLPKRLCKNSRGDGYALEINKALSVSVKQKQLLY